MLRRYSFSEFVEEIWLQVLWSVSFRREFVACCWCTVTSLSGQQMRHSSCCSSCRSLNCCSLDKFCYCFEVTCLWAFIKLCGMFTSASFCVKFSSRCFVYMWWSMGIGFGHWHSWCSPDCLSGDATNCLPFGSSGFISPGLRLFWSTHRHRSFNYRQPHVFSISWATLRFPFLDPSICCLHD